MHDDSSDVVRATLSKLIDQHIKLMVRKDGRAQPAYEGKILSVGKDTLVFDCEYARADRPAGRFTFQISDIHGWMAGDDVVFTTRQKR
jgi:hypothetical protein